MRSQRHERVSEVFLGACDLDGEGREAYLERACAGDPALRAHVDALLARDGVADHAIDLVGLNGRSCARPALPESIGPYRILRSLAHGGTSDVYVGVRGPATRQVAVKVLSRGFESRKTLARFELEACVLATLKHPNIARFLDAGGTRDGRPYIVMEFIEGAPIDVYCDRHRLSTTERLALFRTVCMAVQHAHTRLVVHRDLKPSNIIVQNDGIPKLLDFGIAKLLDPELSVVGGELTGPAQQMLSPHYASPEQVRGVPVTTATDVYSLGVLLYELVAGRRPYQLPRDFGPSDVHRLVCQVDPIKPSAAVGKAAVAGGDGSVARLRRRLRGDIDTIVLTCLRKDPARRYDTVEQLSGDIHRHLEGRPIMARRDTLAYRSQKYLRRNKVGVTVFVLTSVIIAASLAVAWQSARARAADERSGALAEKVSSFAQSVLGTVNGELERLDASLSARQALVAESLNYLNDIAGESGGSLELDRQLATAYDELGEIQGGRYVALGDYSGALESFQKAAHLRGPVLAAFPDDAEILAAVARNRHAAGVALYYTGRPDEAGAAYQEAAAIYKRVTAADSAWRSDYCAVLSHEARMLRREGRLVESERAYAEANSIGEAFLRKNPGDAELLAGLSSIQIQLGTVQRVMGRIDAAMAAYDRAVAMIEKVLDLEPRDARWQYRAVKNQLVVAECCAAIGRPDEALDRIEWAFTVCDELTARHPESLTSLEATAQAHRLAGAAHLGRAEWPAARASFETGQSLVRQLMAADAVNKLYRGHWLANTEGLSDAAKGVGDTAGALALCEQALGLAAQLERDDPGNPWWPRLKFELLRKAGVLDGLTGDRVRSRKRLTQAWNGFASLLSSKPLVEILIDGLVSSFHDLAGPGAPEGAGGLVEMCERTALLVSKSAAAYHEAGYDDRAIETAKEALHISLECPGSPIRRSLEAQIVQYHAEGRN